MKKTVRFFVVLLFIVLCTGISVIAEEITLTTYYPAPFGNYNELQAEKLAVGSSTTMPSVDGDLAALRIAVGSGATMPTTDGDLVSNGTIRANTGFNFNGTDGHTGSYQVVTDVQMVGLAVQKKTRTITIQGGIITDVSGESAWQ
ncbi:MAG: hypothetical protein KKC66_01385 [Candidatus Omnitrophica bacterium]|nr:hypothetical protein [Candidatus Omnitrophota bacterium]MBU1932541.1 hypothetical protein [Candidatus Omnitrophota bacterium]